MRLPFAGNRGLLIVTLSVAKGLSCEGEILRSAQNDKSPNQDTGIIKGPGPGTGPFDYLDNG